LRAHQEANAVFGRGDLVDAMIADVRAADQRDRVLTSDFKLETLPAHLFMNFKVIDEHGRQLEMGRNLATLQAELGARRARASRSWRSSDAGGLAACAECGRPGAGAAERRSPPVPAPAGEAGRGRAPTRRASPVIAATNITSWTFGELPELLEISQGKLTLIGFPALVDKGTHCDLEVFDDPNVAARTHRIGLRRLFALQFKDQLKFAEKNIPGLQQMGMQFMSVGSPEELREQIVNKAIDIACLQDPLPMDAASFNKRKDEGKGRIGLLINEIARLAGQILAEFHGMPKRLQNLSQAVAGDMQASCRAGAQALHRRHRVQPAVALPALPEGDERAPGKAAHRRSARDAQLMAEWQTAAAQFQRTIKTSRARTSTRA
jgi:ATP-dependent helicase HrpA